MRFLVIGILCLLSVGCCSTRFSPEAAKAIGIWQENTTYLNAAFSDVLENKFPNLERPLPGDFPHYCPEAPDPQAKHIEHLTILAKVTDSLAKKFRKLAEKTQCGD